MKSRVFKFDPSLSWDAEISYKPVFVKINKKIYRTDKWSELFQILLFSYCFKQDKLEPILNDIRQRETLSNGKYLVIRDFNETSLLSKFAPFLYVRVFSPSSVDCEALSRIQTYSGKDDLDVYLVEYNKNDSREDIDRLCNEYVEEYGKQNRCKYGSTKHLIAHINGKVLSDKEKFYWRIEKEFDRTTLIGDIEIKETEEILLKEFMKDAIMKVASDAGTIARPKVFAYGLVRFAQKHYESKTFWPYLKQEYDVSVAAPYQSRIREKFKEIMQQNEKLYDDSDNNSIHNICMHAFVCDKYANRFFDFMFDFWRLDLSRSIENCIDDDGNNLFDILIEEISRGSQDIKLHTSMALKMNPKGCKNRFRRILRMIDNSYWNDAEYQNRNNRITDLFNKWKDNPQSSFSREIKKTTASRRSGRGEKLLSRPTILYNPAEGSFRLFLPKQILRGCTEEEHPYWSISVCDKHKKVFPNLLRGKAFLFTEEMSINIPREQLFEEIDIRLNSERINYYRRRIIFDEVRFFNSKCRNIDPYDGYLSKDVAYILTKPGSTPHYVNGSFSSVDSAGEFFDVYQIEPTVGDVLILPNRHALSIGKPLDEGIISERRMNGVHAMINDNVYFVTNNHEKIFFKCSKIKLNGTSIKILNGAEQIYFGKAIDNGLLEFKLDDGLEDVYGYIFDLKTIINVDGAYSVQLSIPGYSIRTYNICYIKDFNYVFKDAPYIFIESGTIEFSQNMQFKTNNDWSIENGKKTLEFSCAESEREINKYVKNRKLRLEYMFKNYTVELFFDLPVLYWKYEADGEWLIQKPEDVMIKTMPKNIYVTGNLNLRTAKISIDNAFDLDDAEVGINYDKDKELYYFRTVDIASYLNRELLYRNLIISVNDRDETFLKIVCRSDVRSQSISGDFKHKKIYGYFDIYGDSEYMVTIKRGNKIIEEDIPLKDGEFEVECEVEEGLYTINLYELEDDDTGFGSISYKLGEYSLEIVDERNFNGKVLTIKYIRNRNRLLSDLQLSNKYVVVGLERAEYKKDIREGSIYTWLYDPDDTRKMSSFEYYWGTLGYLNKFDVFCGISTVVVIFDNDQNTNEVLINLVIDGFFEGLKYNPKRGSLIAMESVLARSERRMLKMIDDDLYRIGVEVGGTL